MEILDFETHFESAAKTFLDTYLTDYADIQYGSSLDQGNFSIPRIEINAELQGADDPPTKDDLGNFNYSQYSLNFLLKIVTDASDDTTIASTGLSSSEFHKKVRRQVRESMLLSSNNFTDTTLEYYEVKYIRPTGTDYEVDGDFFISTLSYEIKFCTKDDKWTWI
jgi:hypothetical protein